MQDPAVLSGNFDVYLTTYETMMSEEAFFTESLLFHTITIDEGHRLKNENSALCKSLGRLSVPFRLLLTGTPLQNNIHELWALMHYVLPDGLLSSEMFDTAADLDSGDVDTGTVSKAKRLLESMMIRRVKADVEHSLLPKLEYTLRVPLTLLQRQLYQLVLAKDEAVGELMNAAQLMALMMQLQKLVNHPKCILLQQQRDQEKAKSLARRAAGSEFIKIPTTPLPLTDHAASVQTELKSLTGNLLASSSGKLALLDRLLDRLFLNGSRVLIFSQFTLMLDVLEEYCTAKLGSEGYLRLDGSTNRIVREMDVRSFNAPGSPAQVYLISTRAGGQGINLATADTVVLYDSCWNPQVPGCVMLRSCVCVIDSQRCYRLTFRLRIELIGSDRRVKCAHSLVRLTDCLMP